MTFDDPLQLFPVEKWFILQEALKADWPRAISGFTVLETERRILQCGLDYGFKVYCPYGNVSNGIVAVNIKKTFHELIVQCPSDDTSQLEDALKTTQIIDWDREWEVPFAPKHVIDCIKRVIQDKRLYIRSITVTTAYVLDKTSEFFNVTLPPAYSFTLLSLEHVELLDSTWPHRYPNSEFYFELLIKANLGYGLFRGGKLISWVLIKEMGALTHLYTLAEERRKGYGELVLKLISDVLRKDGKPVVAFCVAGNDKADKLYRKLKFQSVMDVLWCTFSGKMRYDDDGLHIQ